MELLHAILYTSKNILSNNGNIDLYYFFALILIIAGLTKIRCKEAIAIFIFFLPLASLAIFMGCLWPDIILLKLFVWCIKMLLNICLMVYVIFYFEKINVWKLIKNICLIYSIEIAIALLFSQSTMWRLNDLINGFSLKRLQLTYTEPSELSFYCSLLLIFIVHHIVIIERKYTLSQLLCMFIVLSGMVLSAGMSGILASVISISVMCAWEMILKRNGKFYIKRSMFCLVCIGSLLIILALLIDNAFIDRLNAVFNGRDSSFNTRVFLNFHMLKKIMEKTNRLGVGFGNLNTEYGLMIAESRFPITNSFMYFMAEAGAIGVILLAIFIGWMLKKCFESQDCLCVGLFIFIFIYQIVGGYFTNPVNYLVYGIILYRVKQRKLTDPFNCKRCDLYAYDR